MNIVPPPVVTVTPSTVTQYYNQTVSLMCTASSLVEVTLQWTTTAVEDSLPQSEQASSMFGVTTSSLELSGVSLDNSGVYTCTATNSEGGGRTASDSATVNVLGGCDICGCIIL